MDGSDQPVSAPTKAEARRAQVLEAAAACFNREGFHGASMASIAAEAGVSVGQIYRDFANKEAVIAALVACSMEDWSKRMAAVRARSGDLVDEMLEAARYHAEKLDKTERAALSLECLAEAARNPRIAEIVCGADCAVRAHFKEILVRGGARDEAALTARLNIIAVLIDGWAVRTVKDPSLNMEDYLAALRPVFEGLLSCAKLRG